MFSRCGVRYLIAEGSSENAEEVLNITLAAGLNRISTETENSRLELSLGQSEGPEATKRTRRLEKEVLDAWYQWYCEAIQSTGSLLAEHPSGAPENKIAAALDTLKQSYQTALTILGL